MDDKTFLQQKIDFLEIQVKDFKSREVSLKSHFDSVINSVLAVTSPSLTQEYAIKIEDLKQSHFNELSILKFFYKQRVDLLQGKLSKYKEGFDKEVERLRLEKEKIEAEMKEFKYENQQMRIREEMMKGKVESLAKKQEEIDKLRERFNRKKQVWKVKKKELKDEVLVCRENMEKGIEDIKNYYENKEKPDVFKNFKVLQDVVDKLVNCLRESSKDNENIPEFRYFISEIDKKLLRILLAINQHEKQDQVLTINNKNFFIQPENSNKTFASPPPTKPNENSPSLVETCKKFSLASCQKPPIHSPKHIRSFTQANLSPFSFQHSDRFSLQDTQDTSRILKTCEKNENENFVAQLSIKLARLKNLRNKGRNENEKLLLELKDSKFNLAAEKEKTAEKFLKVENEAKRILNVVRTMHPGLENYQREIARSVYSITKILN